MCRGGDIRTLTKESFHERTGRTTVDLISGGFPCQPFSVAGKQRGHEDDRYLWPEMLRVIEEIRPAWVLGENVENAVRMVIDEICDSLESINYQVQPFVVSAYCSGAWFDGKRTFIVASTNDGSAIMRRNPQLQPDDEVNGRWTNNRQRAPFIDAGKRWQEQSRPVGVVDGVPDRVDRISCAGNAVNPYQVYPILKAMAEIEVIE